MSLRAIRYRVARWLRGRRLPIWYDRRYRPPIPAIAPVTAMTARRADYVAGYLIDRELILPSQLRSASTQADLCDVLSPSCRHPESGQILLLKRAGRRSRKCPRKGLSVFSLTGLAEPTKSEPATRSEYTATS